MKVAIVHDYLNRFGGAERVLEVFHELFPDAVVFTIIYDAKAMPRFRGWDIRTSFVQGLPYAAKYHKNYLPLFPRAVRSFDLKGFDLVISNTHAWGNHVKLEGETPLICYCHTPLRYIWDLYPEYMKHGYINPAARLALSLWAGRMRRLDIETSKRVTDYIAVSETVASRIRDYYKRDSLVINSPCDTGFFRPGDPPGSGDYYLTVSRLKAYKRLDIVIHAFNGLGLPLKIVGEGPEFKRLRRMASPNIEFTGWINDGELLKAYQNCRAFVFAGNEDFGLAMVEAQACGKPVIAYAKGGAREIMSEGKTGLLFYEQAPSALVEKIRCFQNMKFDKDLIRAESLRFKKEIFKEKIMQFIDFAIAGS